MSQGPLAQRVLWTAEGWLRDYDVEQVLTAALQAKGVPGPAAAFVSRWCKDSVVERLRIAGTMTIEAPEVEFRDGRTDTV